MSQLKNNTPQGFDSPGALPHDQLEAEAWQESNQTFWENSPMRYDWKKTVGAAEFSREFYDEIDQRFFNNAREYMPWQKVPFEQIIDFEWLIK